jgi:hypothetical protein
MGVPTIHSALDKILPLCSKIKTDNHYGGCRGLPYRNLRKREKEKGEKVGI